METSLTFKDRAKQALYFAAGIGQGAVDTIKDLAKLSILPQLQVLDSLKKTADFARHPQEKAEKAYQQAKQDYQDLQKLWNHPKEEILKKSEKVEKVVQEKWQEFQKPFKSENPNERAKAWGELSFNVGSMLYGAGELKGLLGVQKEVAVLGKAAKIETQIISKLSQTEAKTALSSLNSKTTFQTAIQLHEKLPGGFNTSKQFSEFGDIFQKGLLKTSDPEAIAVLRGSSVTGVNHKYGFPFDTMKKSDLDLAVISPSLVNRVEELGGQLRAKGTRTGPLDPAFNFENKVLNELNLVDTIKDLEDLSNRKITIMIYRDENSLAVRGEYIKFGGSK